MQGMSIFMACLGLIAIASFSQINTRFSPEQQEAHAVALNFAQYRRAVDIHALANPGVSGTIAHPILGLSDSWVAMHPWSNLVSGGCCYVFGSANAEEVLAVQDLFTNSYAIGVKRNGSLVTAHGVGVALPSSIPDGCLVSVIQL